MVVVVVVRVTLTLAVAGHYTREAFYQVSKTLAFNCIVYIAQHSDLHVHFLSTCS
jgi:hypothetical protein